LAGEIKKFAVTAGKPLEEASKKSGETLAVRAQDAMARFGIIELLGSDHLFHSVEEAFQALGKQGPTKDKPSSDRL